MKKVIIALLAVGAVITLRSAVGRSGQKLREQCKQVAGKCKQGEAGGMHEHCKQMMAAHDETAEKRERAEQEAPQFEGQGEAVAV
jgi:hypothetical protein